MARHKNPHIRRTHRRSQLLYLGLVLAGVVFEWEPIFSDDQAARWKLSLWPAPPPRKRWFWTIPGVTLRAGPYKSRNEAAQRAKLYREGTYKWAMDRDE